MSTEVLACLRPAPPSSGDDGLFHWWCCDEDVAMCGADISGMEPGTWDGEEPLCPLCDLADQEGRPCPVPGCPGVTGNGSAGRNADG